MGAPSRRELARNQIAFARSYTITLLDSVGTDDWFRVPEGARTHIAWQVGHLTMAQYMLTLFRLRGKTEDDERMVPKAFLKRFVKGTTPDSNPESYPPAEVIRETFNRVHERLMLELPSIPEEHLDAPVVEPYAVEANRFGSLLFCSHHEMLHAGQIGLIRRLLGKSPIR